MAVAAVYKQKNVRPMIAVIFGLFFLMNILLFVLALLAAIKGGKAPQILPADVGGGVRLLIFILGLGASWGLGRWLFMQLIDGEVPIVEAGNAAQVMLFYLLLVFAGLAFLSGFSWIWQGVILLVLLLLTIFGLGRILGLPLTIGLIVVVIILGTVLFFVLS
jgi:hypothetical protein